ncbi:hypothetical protein J6590_027236 [Homalodisca vitripennis]|nr:hypothetical protein J6590_027236 [Homalodisca vitripennis]
MHQPINAREQNQSTTSTTGRVCQTQTQKQSTTTITGRVCQTPTQKQCTTTTTDDGPTTQLATSLIHQYEDESPPEKNKQVIKQNPGSVILSQDKTNLRGAHLETLCRLEKEVAHIFSIYAEQV